MEEVWKDIPGYEGLYQVSNRGNVRSLNWNGTKTTKNINQKPHKNGYRQVLLSKDGVRKMFTVHRLVALVFIPNPNELPQINHIDEDKTNNDVSNLEWCSAQYNVRYSIQRRSPRTEKSTRKSKYHNKAIAQLSFDDEIIRVWQGTSELRSSGQLSVPDILRCCRGERKTTSGFKWQFAD